MSAGDAAGPSSDLAQLERLCDIFYSGGSALQQKQAHDVLLPLASDPTGVPQLQAVLAQSSRETALIFASSALLKIFTSSWNRVPDVQKDDTRRFLLNYLYNNAASLVPTGTAGAAGAGPAPATSALLAQSLTRLLCRIVKLGWLEKFNNQNIVEQVSQFLKADTASHWAVGLAIYEVLTEDMQPSAGPRYARQRRVACSFREIALKEIFKTAQTTMKEIHWGSLPFLGPGNELLVLKFTLRLFLNCVGFDFSGGAVSGDAGDEPLGVAVPSSWTGIGQSTGTLFELYAKTVSAVAAGGGGGAGGAEVARLCLQCLVYAAALRRSYFPDDVARKAHLASLVEGTRRILADPRGAASLAKDDGCYHHFCRLLSKINTGHHLGELVAAPQFQDWLAAVFDFSLAGLRDWRRSPNSKHYLAAFWGNLAATIANARASAVGGAAGADIAAAAAAGGGGVPAELRNCVIAVALQFVEARLAAAAAAAADGADGDADDPFANAVLRGEQLDVVSQLARAALAPLAKRTVEHFDAILAGAGMPPAGPFSLGEGLGAGLGARLAAGGAGGAAFGSAAGGDIPTADVAFGDAGASSASAVLAQIPGPQGADAACANQAVFRQKATSLIYIHGALITSLAGQRLRRSMGLLGDRAGYGLQGGGAGGRSAARPAAAATENALLSAIIGRVFHLMKITDGGAAGVDASSPAWVEFELAYIYFMEQVRDLYIGERAREMSQDAACSVPPPLAHTGSGGHALFCGAGGGGGAAAAALFNSLTPYTATTARSSSLIDLQLKSAAPAAAPQAAGAGSLPATAVQISPEIMSLLIEKIVFNLRSRARSEVVIKRTLAFFSQSVHGVTIVQAVRTYPSFVICGQLLLESPLVQHLLKEHQDPTLTFLREPSYGRHKALYYCVLTKLALMVPEKTEPQALQELVAVFEQPISADLGALVAAAPGAPLDRALRQRTIDLARYLRGILSSCLSTQAYEWMFAWLVNKPKSPGQSRIDMFVAAVDVFAEDYEVTTPVLKFFAEFLLNRSDRIYFSATSPNGIFLFKVAAKVVVCYGNHLFARTKPITDVYKEKYKGVAACVTLYCNAVCGRYTNFGVFDVYNDDALTQSLKIALQLCLCVNHEDLQAYLKTMRPIYTLLQAVLSEFLEQVMQSTGPPVIAQIVKFAEDGILSFDAGINLECYAIVNRLTAFFLANKTSPDANGEAVRKFLEQEAECLKRILQLIFQLLFSAETSSWGTSHPLLNLILLFPDEFLAIKEQMIRLQPAENNKQEILTSAFADLMSGVTESTDGKNKDVFTRNLYTFSTTVRNTFS